MTKDQAFKEVIDRIKVQHSDWDEPRPEDLEICSQLFDAGVAYADSITPNAARQAIDQAAKVLCEATPVSNGRVFLPGSEAARLLDGVDEVHRIFSKALKKGGHSCNT